MAILARSARHIPGTWGQVAEPNQVDVVTAAVFRCLEQVLHTAETRLARQIIGDVREANRHDRIHDNLPVVHTVTTAHLDVGPHPDADAAPDPPASNSVAKTFGEHHVEPPGCYNAVGISLTLPRIRRAPTNVLRRVNAVGTTMQRTPARVADTRPRSESSIATQACGATPLLSTARRYG